MSHSMDDFCGTWRGEKEDINVFLWNRTLRAWIKHHFSSTILHMLTVTMSNKSLKFITTKQIINDHTSYT